MLLVSNNACLCNTFNKSDDMQLKRLKHHLLLLLVKVIWGNMHARWYENHPLNSDKSKLRCRVYGDGLSRSGVSGIEDAVFHTIWESVAVNGCWECRYQQEEPKGKPTWLAPTYQWFPIERKPKLPLSSNSDAAKGHAANGYTAPI